MDLLKIVNAETGTEARGARVQQRPCQTQGPSGEAARVLLGWVLGWRWGPDLGRRHPVWRGVSSLEPEKTQSRRHKTRFGRHLWCETHRLKPSHSVIETRLLSFQANRWAW